jgi:hypothetical protein
MKTFVAVVALILSTAACSKWEQAWGPNFPQARSGDAAVYLVRDTAPEGAPPVNLTIGRRPIGGLTSLTWMRFDLQPRLYDLHAYGAQAGSELIVTVTPGETRFFQIDATTTGGTSILEISSLDGRRMVGKGQHVMEMAEPPRD